MQVQKISLLSFLIVNAGTSTIENLIYCGLKEEEEEKFGTRQKLL